MRPPQGEHYVDSEERGKWPPQSYAPFESRAADVPLPDGNAYLEIIAETRDVVDVALEHSSREQRCSIIAEMPLAFAKEIQPATFLTSVRRAELSEFEQLQIEIKPPEPTKYYGTRAIQVCSWSVGNLKRRPNENLWPRLISKRYSLVCIQQGQDFAMKKDVPIESVYSR